MRSIDGHPGRLGQRSTALDDLADDVWEIHGFARRGIGDAAQPNHGRVILQARVDDVRFHRLRRPY